MNLSSISYQKLQRYIIAGVVSTFIYVVFVLVLRNVLGLGDLSSSIISYLFVASLMYLPLKNLVFKVANHDRSSISRYCAVLLVNSILIAALNFALFPKLTADFLVLQCFIFVAIPVGNLLVSFLWVFVDQKQGSLGKGD